MLNLLPIGGVVAFLIMAYMLSDNGDDAVDIAGLSLLVAIVWPFMLLLFVLSLVVKLFFRA